MGSPNRKIGKLTSILVASSANRHKVVHTMHEMIPCENRLCLQAIIGNLIKVTVTKKNIIEAGMMTNFSLFEATKIAAIGL